MSNRMKVLAALASIAALACLPPPAEPQGKTYGHPTGFTVLAGYVIPSDDYQDNHPAFGASVHLPLSSLLVLEAGVSASFIPVRSQAEGLSQGRLLHFPAVLGLRLRFPLRSLPLVPFLAAGGGFAVNHFIPDAEAGEAFDELGFDLEETVRGSFLVQAGGGMEIVLSPSMAVDVGCLYRLCRTSSEWSITDRVTGKTVSGEVEAVSLNAVRVVAGFRFSFN